VIIIIV